MTICVPVHGTGGLTSFWHETSCAALVEGRESLATVNAGQPSLPYRLCERPHPQGAWVVNSCDPADFQPDSSAEVNAESEQFDERALASRDPLVGLIHMQARLVEALARVRVMGNYVHRWHASETLMQRIIVRSTHMQYRICTQSNVLAPLHCIRQHYCMHIRC